MTTKVRYHVPALQQMCTELIANIGCCKIEPLCPSVVPVHLYCYRIVMSKIYDDDDDNNDYICYEMCLKTRICNFKYSFNTIKLYFSHLDDDKF